MVEPAKRVALLARPGAACDNLQAALRQAGAEVVLVADPAEGDLSALSASLPQAILVALEPGVEEALDRYDGILLDPAITVIYDEVAIAAHRQGWEVARWARHLAAKLGGHDDVLPPGAGNHGDEIRVVATHAPPAREPDPPAFDAIDFGGLTDEMAAVHFSLEDMALVDTDASDARPASAGSAKASPDPSFAGGQGAVVVLAGIGGPDAVRRFLAALPVGFARPIVVRQRLDGGRHDRLVRQMQRATSLPVELAEAGTRMVDGHVYVLPDGMTTSHDVGVATFAASGDAIPVLAGLPAADSAVLMLSGSDPAAVPEVLAAAGAGALVAAQAPEECFDSAAPMALIAAGGEAGAPGDLARRLTTRWLSLKD